MKFATTCVLFVFTTALASAQDKREVGKTDPSLLTIDRIFKGGEFGGGGSPSIRWSKRGPGYLSMESAAGGQQLVAVDPETGKKEILVPDHWLIPAGETKQLALDGHEFSADGARMLIYTNSKRVWRTNSRGDYWVLDLTTHELRKLGGDFPPATLMFATFSPDGKAIAYWQLDCEGVKEFLITSSADGPYAKLISIRYPKTGERNPAARVGVVPVEGGATAWIDIPGDPREHYLAKMEWNGDKLAVQQFNRLQNTNNVWICDPTGRPSRIHQETDRAWVENNNDFRWLGGGKELLWLSERDGWQHLYALSESGQLRRITKGNSDVIRIEAVDEPGGWIYFLASPDNPTQRYLYKVAIQGGVAERVTPENHVGTNSYSISSDAKWAVHTVSRFARPPVTSMIRLADHSVVKTLSDDANLRKKLDALKPCATEFFRVDIGEGVLLDGWCIKPSDFDPAKKYPVLFHVYGEPAGQTVVDRWGGRNFLWHSMLAQQGFCVFSIDNRGTPAPRGREWRKCVYRQVGILASSDQAAAARALLKERPYLDPTRVAIWGWSGGGSMTLNALFRHPDLYQTGIAVAPVPNQRHYDTIYQERYMGLPSDNVEGYRNGSPITFARHLKGNLLLIHGTGDDNCHYLGMESLIDELIAHNKHFSMLAYPNRSHGINEGKNTSRHLYESMTRYLQVNSGAK